MRKAKFEAQPPSGPALLPGLLVPQGLWALNGHTQEGHREGGDRCGKGPGAGGVLAQPKGTGMVHGNVCTLGCRLNPHHLPESPQDTEL